MADNVLDMLNDKANKIASEASCKEDNYDLLLREIIDAGIELAGYIADNVNIGETNIYIETIWMDCNGDFMIHGGTKDFEADIKFSSLSVEAMSNVINAILQFAVSINNNIGGK